MIAPLLIERRTPIFSESVRLYSINQTFKMGKIKELDTVRMKAFPKVMGQIIKVGEEKLTMQYLDGNGIVQQADFLEDQLELIPPVTPLTVAQKAELGKKFNRY